ncbi:YcaO-like family protein [Blastococcus deserti]|uniref:YcaO-like family protein n=1 Tax=Blastococcus deserti TaxID=2259033 RepID=A0ABW4XAB4_9ACTN
MALVGDGLVARAALHALAQGGVTDTYVIDWAQASRLAEGAPAASRMPRRPWPFGADGSPVPRLCIMCADVVDRQLALELNARCLEHRITFVPGLVMSDVGQVGPVAAAGRTPCLRCVDLRIQVATGRPCLAPYGPPAPLVAALVGRELAARVLTLASGDDPDPRLVHLWADGSVAHHRVLRTWHCPDCGNLGPPPGFLRPGALQSDDGRSAPSRILDLEPELVDPVTGPIRSLELLEPEADDPPFRHWVASLADPGWAQVGIPAIPCGGTSLDDAAARSAALGEAVERASACQPAPVDLPIGPYREVMADAVNPASWELHDAATRDLPGFPHTDVRPEDDVSWAWGWSLGRGRPALVPASRVFVPFHPRTAADHDGYPALSGFAAGTSLLTATVAALLEVIERDAFMIAWRNRLTLPRLDLDRESPDGVGACVAAFEERDIEVRCFQLTMDVRVPTVLAVARRSRPDDPAVVVATAAALDPATACRHALAELAANRLHVRSAMRASAADGSGNGRIYGHPDMAAHLDFWWNADSRIPLRSGGRPLSPEAALRRILAATSAAGLESVAVEITPPELRRLGLAVVKALVPGTYPLTLDGRWPHLGGARLRTAPVKAGLRDAPLPAASLNRLPHPFP